MGPGPVRRPHRRRPRRAALRGLVPLLATVTLACRATEPPVAAPGEPLPGLSPEQTARFEAGRALFDLDIPVEEGLGPTYNQQRCSSCHDLPAVGGSGVERVIRATRWADGRCDLLSARGGDNVQPRVTPDFRALGGEGETIPPEATHAVDMVAPALFGIGLIEAIPEAEILSREDPEDADGNGISGRAARTPQGHLARFGQKGSDATLRDFVQGALLQEMGLTTAAHPRELSVNGVAPPAEADPAPDPEFDTGQVDLPVDYLRFLAPPPPPPRDSAGPDRDTGRRIFEELGCDACHTPSLTTRADAPPPLGGRTVALYSDLLLHDLGPGVEGICSPSASPTEVRTAPLMGLRLRPLLTHDGRATTVPDAIRRHGGEAESSARGFAALPPSLQDALLQFLASL